MHSCCGCPKFSADDTASAFDAITPIRPTTAAPVVEGWCYLHRVVENIGVDQSEVESQAREEPNHVLLPPDENLVECNASRSPRSQRRRTWKGK